MQHVLVYGHEKFERGSLLASVTASESAMDFTGYLTKDARTRVLCQAAAVKQARDFDWFKLVYPATADKSARTEYWEFESTHPAPSMPRFTVKLTDGRTLCQISATALPDVLSINL